MLHELHRLPLCPYIRLHHQFIGKMIVSVQIYAHKRKGGGRGVALRKLSRTPCGFLKHGMADSWGKQMWPWHSSFLPQHFPSYSQVEDQSRLILLFFGHTDRICAIPRSRHCSTRLTCRRSKHMAAGSWGGGAFPCHRGWMLDASHRGLQWQLRMSCMEAWLGCEGKMSITSASSYTK